METKTLKEVQKCGMESVVNRGFTVCDGDYSLCKAGTSYWVHCVKVGCNSVDSLSATVEDSTTFDNFNEAYDEFMKLTVISD